jgi:sorbitol-specific phosphotransferase system component IIA
MIEQFTQIEALHNHPTGTITNGRFVAATASPVPISIVIPQPASSRDLQMLPDGERSFDHKKTWTKASVQNGDTITVASVDYKVTSLQHWTDPETMEEWIRLTMREVVHAN